MDYSKKLLAEVQDAFNIAIERACGAEYIELTRWCLKLQRPTVALKSSDMITTASQRIFSHYMAKATKSRNGEVRSFCQHVTPNFKDD